MPYIVAVCVLSSLLFVLLLAVCYLLYMRKVESSSAKLLGYSPTMGSMSAMNSNSNIPLISSPNLMLNKSMEDEIKS